MNPLRRFKSCLCACVLALVSPVFVTGCANDPTLIPDVFATITDGLVAAASVAQVVNAVKANNNGQQLSLASVLSGYQTATGAAADANTLSFATTFVKQLNTTIVNMQAKAAPASQIVAVVNTTANAVQAQATAAATVPATPAVTPSTSMLHYRTTRQHTILFATL